MRERAGTPSHRQPYILRKPEEAAALGDPTSFLVLEALFLADAYAIHRSRAHANNVTHILISTAPSLLLLVIVVASMQRVAGQPNAQAGRTTIQHRSWP